MRIGELAARADVSTRAVRYYEEQGLLQSERTAGGQRVFPDSAEDRLRLIQELYTAGLSSRVIASFLPCIDTGVVPPETLEQLTGERGRITQRITQLRETGRRLDTLIGICRNSDPQNCRSSLD
ncbi:MerR family transcriptional regulator [Amycolatopsis sp. NPDC005232]|uniref:MerR family transcriptional regulator n=1 Tax=Amycolatopsis sp. NPDC005232 TaxID=3157027 RepID=UPI0033BA4653